jgi:hypothetical protein
MKNALAGALTPLLLAACGGSREFRVTQAATEPLRAFAQAELVPFTVEGLDRMDEKSRGRARDMAAEISGELGARLQSGAYFKGSGRKLRIEGRLVEVDPGSQAARYFLGAGKGEIVADVTFTNPDGGTVARGFASGTVSGGWYGGSLKSAAKRVAKAIVDFIDDNYERALPAPPPPR